ncbi:hypothetical protein V8F20_012445 [Naviculisporaceae sp. PSN 640]
MADLTGNPTITTMRVDTDARGTWSAIVGKAKDLMACQPADAYHRWLVDLADLEPNPSGPSREYDPMVIDDSQLFTGDTPSAAQPEPGPLTTFRYFPCLPVELRQKIFLLSVPAIVLHGYRVNSRPERSGRTHYQEEGALELHIRDPARLKKAEVDATLGMRRDYRDIALYSTSRESRRVASIFYGRPIRYGLPFNPFKDSLHLDMDSLEGRLRDMWLFDRGETWQQKFRYLWPTFKVVRVRRQCPVRHCDGCGCPLVVLSEPHPSLWWRIRSVTLSWRRDFSPDVRPLCDLDFIMHEVPFPWIRLLSERFKQLKHITLEHTVLDDCIWADESHWPKWWINTDDERTQTPFDSSTGNRLYEIYRLQILDQLENAIVEPPPFRPGSSSHPTMVPRKGGLLPHLRSLTVITHGLSCTHPRVLNMPEGVYSAKNINLSRLQVMNRLIEVPTGEGARPTAKGQKPWKPARVCEYLEMMHETLDIDEFESGTTSEVGEVGESDFAPLLELDENYDEPSLEACTNCGEFHP